MNLWALQDFFSKNCIFFKTIYFCCFAQLRHCIFVSFFLIYNIAKYNDVGAYLGKISICAPLSRYCQGLSWQNLFLRPAVQKPNGIIDLVLPSIPSSAKTRGYIDLLFPHIPSSAKTRGYIDLLFPPIPSSAKASGYINLILSHIPSSAIASGYNRLDFASHTLIHEDQRV